jgi:inhibitor of cysteine peptidase
MVTLILFSLLAVPANVQHRTVTPTENGVRVNLARGDLLVVELPSQMSTGFAWNPIDVDTSIIEFAGRDSVGSDSFGGTDIEQIYFKGVSAGYTKVTLAYHQPWEAVSPTDKRVFVEVDVAGPYTGPWVAEGPVSFTRQPLVGSDGGTHLNLCDPGNGSYSRCTPIKNQGGCGSCWAFATSGVIENLMRFNDPSSHLLSEQYLVSCNTHKYSCAGGWTTFDLFKDTFMAPETQPGAVYMQDMPYLGRDLACALNADGSLAESRTHHNRIEGWVEQDGPSVAKIKETITKYGPIFATVCANDAFRSYRAGTVMRGTGSCRNHAIILVGWDDNNGDGYWILRNSWGSGYGDHGYAHIGYGANNIGAFIAAATLVPAPPDPVPPATGCSSSGGDTLETIVLVLVLALVIRRLLDDRKA